MSETTESELEGLYTAIEKSARLLDVPCSRGKVWPVLTTYGEALTQSVIAFRVATGTRHVGELDCRSTMLPKDINPHTLALTNGLTAETDHPIGTLLADIQERFPIDSYGIDFGVVGGFKKIWPFFPADDLQKMAQLAGTPSMPRSLAGHTSLFARYGLDDKVGLLGIDYQDRTMNVYFSAPPAECFEEKAIVSMHREIGLPDPSEQLLKLGEKAFAIYVTLNWDSSKIDRLCFPVMTPDPLALPARLEPKIEQFIKSVPFGAADRKFIYAATSSADGEYYKLQSFYQWRPRILNMMQLSETAETPA